MRKRFAIAFHVTLLLAVATPVAQASEDPITGGQCLRSEFRLRGGEAQTVFVAAPFKAIVPGGGGKEPIEIETDVDVTNMVLPVVVVCRDTQGPTVSISGVRFNKESWVYEMYEMAIVGVKRPNMKNCMPLKSPRIDVYSAGKASGSVRICW